MRLFVCSDIAIWFTGLNTLVRCSRRRYNLHFIGNLYFFLRLKFIAAWSFVICHNIWLIWSFVKLQKLLTIGYVHLANHCRICWIFGWPIFIWLSQHSIRFLFFAYISRFFFIIFTCWLWINKLLPYFSRFSVFFFGLNLFDYFETWDCF